MSLGAVTVSGVPVRLVNGGKKLVISSMLDTGMKGAHAFIDSELATELGLKVERRADFTVVGGAELMGFRSTIGELALEGLPKCSIKGAQVLVGDSGGGTPVLVGEDFLRAVGAEMDFHPDRTDITCKGGAEVLAVPFSQFPVGPALLVGATVILGITLIALLS